MEKDEYSCGLGSVRPNFIQRFANTKWFLFVYSMLGTVQGMSYIYMSATLTTLEKRFKIPSRTIALLMSGNEVSQVMLSLIMSYHGGKGNRPLWISWGVTFSALSCYILALPHYLYGPGKDAIALTREFLDVSVLNSSSPDHLHDTPLLCAANKATEENSCSEGSAMGDGSLTPLVLIFFSQFVLGIGTTLFHSLGQTYLDDHTKKTNAPIIMAMVMSLRMLGPAAGFAFSSFCLSLYIDPSLTPVITSQDPRWIGAWWLGWLVLGSMMLVLAFMMAWFPKELPKKKRKDAVNGNIADQEMVTKSKNLLSPEVEPLTNDNTSEKFTDMSKRRQSILDEGFLESLKRLLQNKLLLYNIFAGVFYIMGESGAMTFSMKYVETQYHTSAAGASMISGSANVIAMVFGFLSSGFLIGKFKPRPKFVLGWNVLLGLVHVSGSVIYIFLGCKDNGLHGLDLDTGKLSTTNDCNSQCGCEIVKYQPVCFAQENTTFYSACHIGCHGVLRGNKSTTTFTNCTCIPTSLSSLTSHSLVGCEQGTPGCSDLSSTYLQDMSTVIQNGPCPVDCMGILYTYVLVGFCIQALSSSGRIGNVLVNFRCVKQKDKVFAQGLSLLIVSLLAFIPGPIIFGAIIDSTCIMWDTSCSEKGNCWLYHKDKFRIYMNTVAAVLTTLGVVLDIKVWQLGHTLDLYGENDPGSEYERKFSLFERRRELSFSEQGRSFSVVDDGDDQRSSSDTKSRSSSVYQQDRKPSFKVEAAE